MELEVEQLLNTEIHKSFTHSAKKIEEIPELNFSMIFNFISIPANVVQSSH